MAFVSQAQHFGKENSMTLIFFPLIFLFIIGVAANNMQNSGLQTSSSLVCSDSTLLCYNNVAVGCDASISNCNFTSATTFSFLSKNSPFTQLLQGNVLGFFNCLMGCNTVVPVSNLIFLLGCTNFMNYTGSKTNNFITALYCDGGSFNSESDIPYPPYNASSSTGNNSQWFIQGVTPPNVDVYATYLVNGSWYENKYCDAVGLCYYSPSLLCSTVNSIGITGYRFNSTNIQYCLFYVILGSSAPNFSNTVSIFSFLAGIVLILLGLGLTIQASLLGSGFTAGVNSQATRMCEVFGFALLGWAFIYSEYGQWLGYFPFNMGIIGYVILTTMYFLGLYWRIFSVSE